MSKTFHDKCLVCQSKNTVELFPENIDLNKLTFTYEFSSASQKTFRIVRCRRCTHVFCSPVPKNIDKNYKDVIDNEYLRHKQARVLTSRAVLKILRHYSPTGLLLDVGCATGDFLDTARAFGYSIEGMELSKWSSKIAQKKHIKIYQERLGLLANRFPGKYDIITMWGVIEHFEQPVSEMFYLNKLLKPNGILALWTGDIDGVMSRLLGRRWWYWQGQHIQYFTNKSLNRLAEMSNFEHITTKYYPIAATYEQMQNSLSRYKLQKYMTLLVKAAFMIKPVWLLRIPGEMLWIARKKP